MFIKLSVEFLFYADRFNEVTKLYMIWNVHDIEIVHWEKLCPKFVEHFSLIHFEIVSKSIQLHHFNGIERFLCVSNFAVVILTTNLSNEMRHPNLKTRTNGKTPKKRPFHSSIDNSTLSCCIHENLLSYDAIAVVFVSSNYTRTQTKTSTKHRMWVKSRVRWIVWRLIAVHRWEWDTALGYASWISNQNSKTSGTSSTSRTSFKPHTV